MPLQVVKDLFVRDLSKRRIQRGDVGRLLEPLRDVRHIRRCRISTE